MKTTVIDLLRHGQPEGGEIFRGTTDVPLNDEGWQQMQASTQLAEAQACPWTVVVTSPMSRCQAFAETLAEQHQLPVHTEALFREIGFGVWEGKSFAEVKADHGDVLRHYWANPVANTPAGGEPMDEFAERITQAWQTVLERFAGEKILLVSHGGVMRAIMVEVLNMPLNAISRISVPYACLTRIQVTSLRDQIPWTQLVFHAGSARDATD